MWQKCQRVNQTLLSPFIIIVELVCNILHVCHVSVFTITSHLLYTHQSSSHKQSLSTRWTRYQFAAGRHSHAHLECSDIQTYYEKQIFKYIRQFFLNKCIHSNEYLRLQHDKRFLCHFVFNSLLNQIRVLLVDVWGVQTTKNIVCTFCSWFCLRDWPLASGEK